MTQTRILILLVLLLSPWSLLAADNEWSIQMDSGVGVVLDPGDKTYTTLGDLPFRISLSYSFSKASVFIEGLMSWPFDSDGIEGVETPGMVIASIGSPASATSF